MEARSDLLARAKECTGAMASLFGDEPTAIAAWLDGYAAGHFDATKSAVKIIGETIIGETPFGPQRNPTCCVCQDREGGCEFCPAVEG